MMLDTIPTVSHLDNIIDYCHGQPFPDLSAERKHLRKLPNSDQRQNQPQISDRLSLCSWYHMCLIHGYLRESTQGNIICFRYMICDNDVIWTQYLVQAGQLLWCSSHRITDGPVISLFPCSGEKEQINFDYTTFTNSTRHTRTDSFIISCYGYV
jgi:hypothetical protein